MFVLLLHNLRTQGIGAGTNEWLVFLDGLRKGLATCLKDLYGFGRTVFCTSESQFDAYDLAFTATFDGVELPPDIPSHLEEWLRQAIETQGGLVEPNIPMDELWEEFYKRLAEQEKQHNGGDRWIGTGGTSPFGHSGRASHGIRVGGKGRNRSAVSMAMERNWASYRTDTSLETRDFQIALKALRKLVPEGEWELDVDRTIQRTADSGGEIELDFRRAKSNRVRLVLLMDSGGSMEPHARRVEQLFTAASELKGFKSFEAWHFHNVPYGFLYQNSTGGERRTIDDLLRDWTPRHRLVWVGDACMAPYELMTPTWKDGMTGQDWLKRIRKHCPCSVWLNPEPPRYWDHPTVRRIGSLFPMHSLSVDGLREAVRILRKGAHIQSA
jgi:uncharacterized protein